jgi:nucleotide-binding universal stress UspA family protein
MEKIIVAIDGLKYSENTVEYGIYLAKETKATLVGIFLEDFTYRSYKLSDLAKEKEPIEKKLRKVDKKDRELRRQSVERFANACSKANIRFSIHHDKNFAIRELVHESVYADLLVIDKKETLTPYNDETPTRFIKDLLSDVNCPVLIISGKPEVIRQIVFLYDGGTSAVYAIKMFSYALPLKHNFKLQVLSVKKHDETDHQIPDDRFIKEYMKLHFPHSRYSIKFGIAENEIVRMLKKMQPDTLVILGAYQRGQLSRWIRESMADVLMKDVSTPLFIAHNK